MSVTITTAPRKVTYNPVVPTTDFPGGSVFPIAASADVDVYLAGVKQVTGYSIIGTFPRGEENSLSTDWIVRFVSGISGQQVDIIGNRNPRRTVVYAEGVGVPARDQNTAFNTLTLILREFYDRLSIFLQQTVLGNYDAQSKQISNVAAGTNPNDAVNLTQLQTAGTVAGNVPAPGAGNIGKWLKALTATTFGWTSIGVADVANALDDRGDTMTGDLTIAKASPSLTLNKAASGQNIGIAGQTSGLNRFVIIPGDQTAEGGSNAGSNFGINRYNDAGAFVAVMLSGNRATGVFAFEQRPTFAGNTPWDTGNKPAIGAPDFWAREELASGTAGGGYTAGADQQCPLNTVKRNIIAGASLGSNQVTLPAGTYYAKWRSWAGLEGLCQSLLFNVTDTATIERGDNGAYGAGVAISGFIAGAAFFTLASAKVIEIRFRGTATRATDGLGQAASFGTEVYRDIEIWKL